MIGTLKKSPNIDDVVKLTFKANLGLCKLVLNLYEKLHTEGERNPSQTCTVLCKRLEPASKEPNFLVTF